MAHDDMFVAAALALGLAMGAMMAARYLHPTLDWLRGQGHIAATASCWRMFDNERISLCILGELRGGFF